VKRPQRPAQRLRQTIDRMPLETRQAMRRAIETNSIIVGAYTNREGGVCPMLAAHRNGGRTDFAAFAVAWDRYTRAAKKPRLATERELGTLRTMLEASIAAESARAGGELALAIDAHLACRAARRVRPSRAAARRDTGERDRTSELAGRAGWAWLRPFRTLDEYERAIIDLEAAAAGAAAQPVALATSSRPRE
jgi:hypothetical protein